MPRRNRKSPKRRIQSPKVFASIGADRVPASVQRLILAATGKDSQR